VVRDDHPLREPYVFVPTPCGASRLRGSAVIDSFLRRSACFTADSQKRDNKIAANIGRI
jgi:hypothetical protein